MKCVKITTSGTFYEVENFEKDEDYINAESYDGYSLMVPEMWKFRKYRLSFLVGVNQCEYNDLATSLFIRLYS